jgi:toxin ParE1/3/4
VKVQWTRTAAIQFERAHEFIRRDNPEAADRQIELVKASVQRISIFPMMGRSGMRAGTREFAVPGTPYIVVYRVREERIEILAVLHGAQNWKNTPRE